MFRSSTLVHLLVPSCSVCALCMCVSIRRNCHVNERSFRRHSSEAILTLITEPAAPAAPAGYLPYRWLSDWLNHAGPICRCNSTLVLLFREACNSSKHVNHVGCRCRSLPLPRELYSRCLRPALDEPGRPIPTGSSQGESGERRVVRILHSRDQTRPDQTRSEQIRCPCHHPEATTSIHHLSAQSV